MDKIFELLDSRIDGLENGEATRRQAKYGANQIISQNKISIIDLIIKQLLNPLITILLIVSVLNFIFDHKIDATVILIIVLINTCIGVYQEFKSKLAVLSLTKITPEYAQVIRARQRRRILARELVIGDIVILEQGDKAPADCRLIEVFDLKVDESSLTGESMAVAKVQKELPAQTILAERKNMVYAGTFVSSGKAKAIVCATAMATEFGVIAKNIIAEEPPPTTLEIQIKQFTRWVIKIAFAMAFLVLFLAILRQYDRIDAITTATAMAVSFIPEGLPALITITLAIGVNRMATKNAIIQNLDSVETLGQITTIATDKTGTLTKNEMTAIKLWVANKTYTLTGVGYNPRGSISEEGSEQALKLIQGSELYELLLAGALCNDAELYNNSEPENKGWTISGDPTDGAILVAAIKCGFSHEQIKQQYPKLDEMPFSTKQKMMAVLVKREHDNLLVVKGAPETILSLCTAELRARHKLSKARTQEIREHFEVLAKEGFRVISVAVKSLPHSEQKITPQTLKDARHLGIFALEDPPRNSVKKSIKQAQDAGIEIYMITGDNEHTARAIGEQIGLEGAKLSISGTEIKTNSLSEINKLLDEKRIFARINPLQKLAIVKALQARKQIVATTGDGVNDAPAIKAANVGIAMGRSGTAISREAAAMVLTDDNFSTIIHAIEEGRNIFQNIRRVLYFLLSTNVGEMMIIVMALVLGMAIPLTAIQILWINLVVDSICSFSLAYEKPHSDLMKRPPRPAREPLLNPILIQRIILVGITNTLVTLPIFYYFSRFDVELARSIAFAMIAVLQIYNVFNARTFNRSISELKFFSNPLAIINCSIAAIITFATINAPFFQNIFHTKALSFGHWLLVLTAGTLVIIVVEIEKAIRSRQKQKI